MSKIHKVTATDVAREAGVSAATVSRVLNSTARVEEETREAVLTAARRLGYARRAVLPKARTLRRTGTIGVVVRDIGNPFYSKIAKNIEGALREQDYTMLLTHSDYDEEREGHLVEMLVDSGADGVLITPMHSDSPGVLVLKEAGIPFMMLNCRSSEPTIDWICSDSDAGAYLATGYLLNLGHPRLMFLRGNTADPGQDRYEGFRRAITENGLKLADQVVLAGRGADEEAGCAAVAAFVEKSGRAALPTAILAVNDSLAIGVLEALDVMGVSVPEDISVMGYDNLDISGFLRVPLTTVDQSEYHMGAMAATRLVERIGQGEAIAVHNILVQPKLVIRKSCLSFAETRR